MKLLLESWRKYVTEELLNEVPLADFGYDDYEYPASDGRKRGPSVGYEKSKDPGYKEEAIKFFDKTKDLWYIVFLKTTLWGTTGFEKIEAGNKDGLFERIQQMQIDNNWDPRGKYIVVSFPRLYDDMSLPKWQIVHDIIGHTIEEYHRKQYGSWQEVAYNPQYKRSLIAVHNALPKEMKIASVAATPLSEDRGPDIYAAIFLGKGPAIEDVPEHAQWLFKDFTEVVDAFNDKIKEGEFWQFGGWD
jgi:hypothetical protein